MQAKNVFDLRQLAIVLIAGQFIDLYADLGLPALAQTQTSTASSPAANMIRTTTELRHAYSSSVPGGDEKLRKQPWWLQRYQQQQQVQRLRNWKDRQEAAEFARNMADPRSPRATAWRDTARRAQAWQAKADPELKTKIAPYPTMIKAKSFAEVEAILAAQSRQASVKQAAAKQLQAKQAPTKQLPAKKQP